MLKGFDISAYQNNIAPAADFVIVKATEGKSYTNSRFSGQWASAKTRTEHRGAYHYARPEQSSAASQAARFLALVKPVPGESVWLDLEESGLNQAQTNAWAKAWGDYIRAHAPGVTSGVYMGSGYASNGTGRDLAEHFSLWWYPQYPTAAKTSTWRTAFSPWLPSGLTCGWKTPHIWQWTSNFNGMDANISPLTLDQLTGTGELPPLEDDMAQVSSLGVDGKQTIAAGKSGDIKFTKEYSDKTGLHGDDGTSVVIAKDKYWANVDAIFCLTGLTPGAKLDVAWTRVTDDGKFLDDAWRLTYTANEHGVIQDEIGGQFGVDATNRLRLRVYNTSDKDAVVAADADGRPATMAKATLLKY